MDIKEIALKVADSLRNKVDGVSHMQSNQGLVRFAEALVAEVAKQNEPVAWARYPKFTGSTQRQEVVFKKPDDLHNWVCLHTLPPTAEQIANETAEACAKFVSSRSEVRDYSLYAINIRNGAWKEFK